MTAKTTRLTVPVVFLVLTAFLMGLIVYLALSSPPDGSDARSITGIKLTALTENECRARADRKVAQAKADEKACPKGNNACKAAARQRQTDARAEEKQCTADARAQAKACEDAAKQAEKNATTKAQKKAAQDQRKGCKPQFRDCPPNSEYANDPRCKKK